MCASYGTGSTSFASSKYYQTSADNRQLFVITEGKEVISYIDLALDRKSGVATYNDLRNPNAPTEFGDLGKLGPKREGFAYGEDVEMGRLLMGLVRYTLQSNGIKTLKMVEYTPNEKDGSAFASAGPQRADFSTHVFHGVTEEVRQTVANALIIHD